MSIWRWLERVPGFNERVERGTAELDRGERIEFEPSLDEERLVKVLRPWLGIHSEKALVSAVRNIAAHYVRLGPAPERLYPIPPGRLAEALRTAFEGTIEGEEPDDRLHHSWWLARARAVLALLDGDPEPDVKVDVGRRE